MSGNTEVSDSPASDGGEARIRYRGSDLTSNAPERLLWETGQQPDVISAQHDLGYRVRTGPQDRALTERPSDMESPFLLQAKDQIAFLHVARQTILDHGRSAPTTMPLNC
jgi:hypothetical protein